MNNLTFDESLIEIQQFGCDLGRDDCELDCDRDQLWREVIAAGEQKLVSLDFGNVSWVSSRWLQAVIGPLYDRLVHDEIDLVPCLRRFPGYFRGELEVLADSTGRCFPVMAGIDPGLDSVKIVGNVPNNLMIPLRIATEWGAVTPDEVSRKIETMIDFEEIGSQPSGIADCEEMLDELYQLRLVFRREGVYSGISRELVLLPSITWWDLQGEAITWRYNRRGPRNLGVR